MSSINGEFIGLIVEQQPKAVKGNSEEKAEEKVEVKKAAPKKSAKK